MVMFHVHAVTAMDLATDIRNTLFNCSCCQGQKFSDEQFRSHHKHHHHIEIYDCPTCGPEHEKKRKEINQLFSSFAKQFDINQLKRKLVSREDSTEIPLRAPLKRHMHTIDESVVKNSVIAPTAAIQPNIQSTTYKNVQLPNDLAAILAGRNNQVNQPADNLNQLKVRALFCKRCGAEQGHVQFRGQESEIIDNFDDITCDFCSQCSFVREQLGLPPIDSCTNDPLDNPGDVLTIENYYTPDIDKSVQNYLNTINQVNEPIQEADLRICAICSFIGDAYQMMQHINSEHIEQPHCVLRNTPKDLCSLCNKIVRGNNRHMANHIIKHYRKGSFRCPYCGNIFDKLEAVSRHCSVIHYVDANKDPDYIDSQNLHNRLERLVAGSLKQGVSHDKLDMISELFKEMPLFVGEERIPSKT
jgi:hypothetical protein